jgi:hypothetical protein
LKKKIVITTSNSLRHKFFAEKLCIGLEVKKVYIEGHFMETEYIKYENLNIDYAFVFDNKKYLNSNNLEISRLDCNIF